MQLRLYIHHLRCDNNRAYRWLLNATRMAMTVTTVPQIAKFMGSTWGPPGSCRPQMSPMLAPWTLLLGSVSYHYYQVMPTPQKIGSMQPIINGTSISIVSIGIGSYYFCLITGNFEYQPPGPPCWHGLQQPGESNTYCNTVKRSILVTDNSNVIESNYSNWSRSVKEIEFHKSRFVSMTPNSSHLDVFYAKHPYKIHWKEVHFNPWNKLDNTL